MAVIAFYNERNADSFLNVSAGWAQGEGQSFAGNGATIGSAAFYLKKTGSPTGTANAKIYAITGTFGTTSTPTGAALATSDNFTVSTLTTTPALATFIFSGVNQIALTNGTKYFLTLEYTAGDASNFILPGVDTTSPSHVGNEADSTALVTWVATSSQDICFYVYDLTGVPSYMMFNNYQQLKVGDGMSTGEKIR